MAEALKNEPGLGAWEVRCRREKRAWREGGERSEASVGVRARVRVVRRA
jgi:hypothetical protein